MAMDKKLLKMLCCPVSKNPLEVLEKQALQRLNQMLEQSQLKYADGSTVSTPAASGLITADGTTIYLIDDGIPMLLPELGIPSTQLD